MYIYHTLKRIDGNINSGYVYTEIIVDFYYVYFLLLILINLYNQKINVI